MKDLFEKFLKEKQFLCNISPKTIRSYRQAFTAFTKVVGEVGVEPTERANLVCSTGSPAPLAVYSPLSNQTLKDFVIGMRESGLSPGACNVYIRSMNSFLTWLFENGHTTEHLRLKQVKGLREPILIFKPAHIQALIRFKPRNDYEWRLHTLVCLLIDTGARID